MRFKAYLQEVQNYLQITDLDWNGLSGYPLQLSRDIPALLLALDHQYPGVKLEVSDWEGPNDVPLVTVWGPPKSMEKFLLWYAFDDPNDADDLLAMCEKVVK